MKRLSLLLLLCPSCQVAAIQPSWYCQSSSLKCKKINTLKWPVPPPGSAFRPDLLLKILSRKCAWYILIHFLLLVRYGCYGLILIIIKNIFQGNILNSYSIISCSVFKKFGCRRRYCLYLTVGGCHFGIKLYGADVEIKAQEHYCVC